MNNLVENTSNCNLNVLSPAFRKKISMITEIYSWFEDICQAQKYNSFPLDIPLSNFNKNQIESTAMMTREILGIKSSVIIDLASLLEAYGLRIVSISLPKEITSFAYYSKSLKSITFFINNIDSIERNTFSLAHELAHIIFHQGSAKYKLYEPHTSVDAKEKIASYFAACFLMPEQTMKLYLNQLGLTTSNWTFELLLSIKYKFGVSCETFLYRLHELNLISRPLKNSFLKEIKSYYKKNSFQEPNPLMQGNRYNSRLKDLVLVAKQRKKLTKEIKEKEKELYSLGLI